MEFLSSVAASDLAVIGIMIALFALYSWWQDTGVVILIAISMPIAGFFFNYFPYHDAFAELTHLGSFSQILFFIVLLALSAWIVRRTVGIGIGGTRPIHVITTSLALAILIVSFSYHIIPIDGIYEFGPFFDSIFGSVTNFFWITALALLALFVV